MNQCIAQNKKTGGKHHGHRDSSILFTEQKEAEPRNHNLLSLTTSLTTSMTKTKNKKKKKKKKSRLLKGDARTVLTLYEPGMNVSLASMKNVLKQYKTKGISKSKKDIVPIFERIQRIWQQRKKIIALQKKWHRYYIKTQNQLHGPAVFDRSLCTNSTDVLLFDSLEEIRTRDFISFQNEKGYIYGFHYKSLQQLLDRNMKNPYTREEFPVHLYDTFHELRFQMKCRRKKEKKVSPYMRTKKRLQRICARIQKKFPGWFLDVNWVYNLTVVKLKILYKRLFDEWHYRIPKEQQRVISYPHENVCLTPVRHMYRVSNITDLRKVIVQEIFNMTQTARESDNAIGGIVCVLTALSKVSKDASDTTGMPHSYE